MESGPDVAKSSAIIAGAAAALSITATVWLPATQASADEPNVQFISSPTGNISCEMDFQRATLPSGVFCSTRKPPQNVFMDINGVSRICSGEERCLSDAPENSSTLAYGQNMGLGPFNCLSESNGMTCTIQSGHGFIISDSGIEPISPHA